MSTTNNINCFENDLFLKLNATSSLSEAMERMNARIEQAKKAMLPVIPDMKDADAKLRETADLQAGRGGFPREAFMLDEEQESEVGVYKIGLIQTIKN